MMFNYFKKTNVNYIILPQNDIPKGIYPNINYYPNYKTGCPAMESANKKIFYVNAPYNLDIEFGLDKNDEAYYKYEFDKKINTTSDYMHNLIKKTFSVTYDKNLQQLHLQIIQPYNFVTDNIDLEITTLPIPIQTTNGHYVIGAMKPFNWIRNLNFVFMSDDTKKTTELSLRIDKPIMMYFFNKPINLKYTEPTKKMLDYRNQSNGVINYRTEVGRLYRDIISRRPRKFL